MDGMIRYLAVIASTTALLLPLVGCQAFNARSDWDHGITFSSFRNYFWLEPPEREQASPFADNTLLRQRVRAVVEDELTRRGLRRSQSRADADFLVTYTVLVEERLEVDGLDASIGGSYHHGHHSFGSFRSTPSVDSFQEATLIIDFLDPKSEALVWRGWGMGMLGTRDRERDYATLARGVEAILAKYPPNN
jgi:hypothetical protein